MPGSDFQRTTFGTRLLLHALRDRARRETGSPDARTSPMFDDWTDGIHEWVRRQTAEHVAERGIRLHSHVAAVNSSMAFAFNLFMPFREHGASGLDAALSEALGFRIRVVGIELEVHGSTGILAECAGPRPARREKFTASDVGIRVEDAGGHAGVVLVEVKLSEGEYSHCNGATSDNNMRKDVCAAAETFFGRPRDCYLTRPRHAARDRRYWEILETVFGSVRAAFAAFGLVHHPANHHVVEPWDEYRRIVPDASRLFRMPADELLDAAAGPGGEWSAWARYTRERYMLPTGGAGQ